MVNKEAYRRSPALLGFCIFSFLVVLFGRYIPTSSFDLVQHFLLVDEIMKHAIVRPESFQRIGTMALYPPGAHWVASVIGWITGSGLVGIVIVTIASAYLCYLFIAYLVGASTPANVLLFAFAFLALRFTRSQIGWEVVSNFFYPQLVADAVYFGVLLWASNNHEDWKQAIIFMLAGTVSMWIQPLVAVHILAAGCALMTFHVVENRKKKNAFIARDVIVLLLLVAASTAIILANPAFSVMRNIASNDGDLVLGYNHLILVAVLCAVTGTFNLWKRLTGSAPYVDAVLGSAVIAAVCLAILQFALLKLHGDGSAYAVKKHMFITVTLGIINAVRAIANYFPQSKRQLPQGIAASLLAGFASFFVLRGFNTPMPPILSAMAYANHAANYQLPEFTPGDIVADDSSLPLMGNVMISLTAFEHPFDARAISWQRGTNMKDGARYTMVVHTPEIDQKCSGRLAESHSYVIVEPSCLKR